MNPNANKGLRGAAVMMLVCALAACGGGGVRENPPVTPTTPPTPPAPPYTPPFTPTVAIDASLTQVNPPAIPTQGGPVTFAEPNISKHLILDNAAGALGAGLKGAGVTIGFLDSGVDRSHPALTGRVAKSFVHVNSPPNNTKVDDVVGHGTTVASIAAGRPATGKYSGGQTGLWPGGIAQDATIVSSRIISDARPVDDGTGQGGNEITVADDYGGWLRDLNRELANAGAKIINNSWGGLYWNAPGVTAQLDTAYRDFVVNYGGIIVFANGNEGTNPNLRPNPSDNAALPSLANDPVLEKGWLTVGALDTDNPTQLAYYSQECGIAMNYCLVAPGNVTFVSVTPAYCSGNSNLCVGGGTSFAAPQVSGAAAVVWSAFPYFTNDQVRQTILGTATDLGDPGVDPIFGWGLLNVSKAANGPGNFAWGDFNANVPAGTTSVWRNNIVGDGGLIKSGSGTLILDGNETYTGDTRVQAGGLYLHNQLGSNLFVSSGATVWATSNYAVVAVNGNIKNDGNFFNGANNATQIYGNFNQSASGNVGVWLNGLPLFISGTATLAGQISILGVQTGYTTRAQEPLLSAGGGISGTFSSLKSAPNVFLDATLSYGTNDVFLNISRIDVTHAVAALNLTGGITPMSATRMEYAMQAIDSQLANGAGGIDGGFIDGAGQFQQITSAAQAVASLRSLSGELHATADAMTFDNITSNRRTLAARFGEIAAQTDATGSWYRAVGKPGQNSAGFGNFLRDGWVMGSDAHIGPRLLGFAFGETVGNAYDHGDRSRDRQTQAQFYTGGAWGNAYALSQFGAGRYQRQLSRELLLGDQRDYVGTEYTGNFFSANFEAGYRLGALTPYAGIDYVRLNRDGFIENGGDGFGLKANSSSAERTQAVMGLRAQRAWATASGRKFTLRGYVEWQQSLSENGLLIDASFVGAESWSSLYGAGFSRGSGLFGLGLDSRLSRRTTLSFGYDRRVGSAFDDKQWSAKLRYGF